MTIDVLKRLALDAEEHDRFEDALNLYRLALVNAEETGRRGAVPPLQVRVGDILLRLGQPQTALPLFTTAGHAYARKGMGPEVVAIGDRVLRAAPGSLRIFLAWTRTLFEHGHSATATAVLEVFVRRSPRDNTRLLHEAAERMRADPLRILVEDVARRAARVHADGSGGALVTATSVSEPAPNAASAAAPPAEPTHRSGNTEPRVTVRSDPLTLRPRTPQAPLRPRPGAPGWRDVSTTGDALSDEEEVDRLLVPQPFVRDTPFDEVVNGASRESSAAVREPFFRRVPRSRWRPVIETAFWVTAAAAAVFALLKAGLL